MFVAAMDTIRGKLLTTGKDIYQENLLMASNSSDNGSPQSSGQPSADEAKERAHAVSTNTAHLERFTRSFEVSARRWELVVYPSLFAFIVLAAYGFFLVYSLTQDVSQLSRSIAQMTVAVDSMSENMHTVSNRMQSVSLNMDDIAHKMDALEPMRATMESIDRSTQVMSVTTDAMRVNMTGLNHQMAGMNDGMGPLRTMSGFMPFR